MSASFRLNYTPEPLPSRRRFGLTVAIAAFLAAAIAVTAFAVLITQAGARDAQAAPATDGALGLRLRTADPALAQARIDAYRAGYAAALDNACRPPALTLPTLGAIAR